MLLEECEELFGADDLYGVLHIENKKASAAEVKKAYYRQSMKWHPDKVTDEALKEIATRKFQVISRCYEVLSDKDKRAVYDQTGSVDEENILSNEDTYNLWRSVFKKVTKEDIEKFCEEYRGSKDEENDVMTSFNLRKGDMQMIMDDIMGTTFEDEDRIKAIIDKLIDDGKLKTTKKYKSSTSKAKAAARKKRGQAEAKEAEEAFNEIANKEGTNDLAALILKRQADRGSVFDAIAEKYANPPKKANKGKKN